MKIYRFDAGAGESIDLFESYGFILSKIARLMEGAIINCAYLAPQGVIGFHETTTDQLFLVVQGEGWVRGAEPETTVIKTGQAVYWGKDEWHESGTERGMTAILIEGTNFDLSHLITLNTRPR